MFTATAETSDRIDIGVIELSVGQRLFGNVTSAVQDAHEKRRVIREIREERRGKWYEMQFVVMTPYLLGVGIALRVAKVTKELYVFREVSIVRGMQAPAAL